MNPCNQLNGVKVTHCIVQVSENISLIADIPYLLQVLMIGEGSLPSYAAVISLILPAHRNKGNPAPLLKVRGKVR